MIFQAKFTLFQLKEFKKSVDARIEKGESKDEAILKELQVLIKQSKKIRFEGNGYGDEDAYDTPENQGRWMETTTTAKATIQRQCLLCNIIRKLCTWAVSRIIMSIYIYNVM